MVGSILDRLNLVFSSISGITERPLGMFDCKKEVLHSINEKIDNLGNKIVSGFIEIKEEINEQKIDNLPENFKKRKMKNEPTKAVRN